MAPKKPNALHSLRKLRSGCLVPLLMAAALTSTPSPVEAQTSCDGTITWNGIVPNCLAPGERYRILFITHRGRNAQDPNIAAYNDFVQRQADGASGNPFNGIEFRALASAIDVDARRNTGTDPNVHGPGEKIFYYLGDKVADNYRDLYDGEWDSQSPRNENGETITTFFNNTLWTGFPSSVHGQSRLLGTKFIALGDPRRRGSELARSLFISSTALRGLYALSEVLAAPGVPPVATLSVDNDSVTEGQPFRLRVKMTPTTAQSVTVYVDTQDLTAVSGSDYQGLTGTAVTVPPGRVSMRFEIPTIDNTEIEPDKQFNILIREGNSAAGETPLPPGVTLGPPISLSLTIRNNDDPSPPAIPVTSTQTATVGTPFTYQIAEVTDPDGDPVAYAATLADGSALPEWLNFDTRTRTFSGTPRIVDIRSLMIRVIASDDRSPPLSSHADFLFEVVAVTGPDQALRCDDPPDVVNAMFTSTGDLLGDTVRYTCIAGSQPTGNPETVCTRIDADTAVFPVPSLRCQLIVPTINRLTAGNGEITVDWRAGVGAEALRYEVVWSPPRQPGGETAETATPNTHTIAGLTNGVEYTVHIVASNDTDSVQSSAMSATPRTVPSPPEITSVSVAGDGLLRVVWEPVTGAANGGAAVTDYQVSWEPPRTDLPTTHAMTADTQYDITGLSGGTNYTVTVAARNAAGFGAGATFEPVTAAQPPDTPRITSVSVAGDGILRVVWEPVTGAANGGAPVTDYQVSWEPPRTDLPTTHAMTADTQYDITGLNGGTNYTVTVAARNAAGLGTGATFEPVTAVETPNAPQITDVIVAGDGLLRVVWEPVTGAANGGAPVTDYQVSWEPPRTELPTTHAMTADTQYDITGLSGGTNYTVTVAARNAAGLGAGATFEPVTAVETPNAPQITDVIVAGDGLLRVVWEPVTGDANGGAPVTDYQVSWEPPRTELPTTHAMTADIQYDITGLTVGTDYTVTVAARNAAGFGAGATFEPVTAAQPPDTPRITSVSVAGDGILRVVWEPVTGAANGGAPVTDYQVSWEPPRTELPTTHAMTADTQYDITGLSGGTDYTVTVAARNAAGLGAGATFAPVTAVETPGAPQNVTATRGDTEISVTWNAPTDTGGAAVTAYMVTASDPTTTAPPISRTVSHTGTTEQIQMTTITGLTNGVAYQVTVTARNPVGDGPANDNPPVVTPAGLPEAPVLNEATVAADAVTLNWQARADNGSPITAYRVFWAQETNLPGAPEDRSSDTTTELTYRITGLEPDTAYRVSVRAENSVGAGPESASTLARTEVVENAPGVPRNLMLNGFNRRIRANWEIPEETGGVFSLTYILEWSTGTSVIDSNLVRIEDIDDTTFTIRGLQNGLEYAVRVSARNSEGTGRPTPVQTATPGISGLELRLRTFLEGALQ